VASLVAEVAKEDIAAHFSSLRRTAAERAIQKVAALCAACSTPHDLT